MTCSKRAFTYQGALDALLNARIKRLRGSTKRRERRAYACRECGCWHLTSKSRTNEEDVA